ncbi:hypothetical protein V1264_006267 [Littorina saxatilis]|uniref:Uncharacterized protein n=1 Tax=Littorina saxatilis TaxID=31220 RepID=A0AAN9AX42_9CAEN
MNIFLKEKGIITKRNRPLQTQAAHVLKIPHWGHACMPLWHRRHDSGTPPPTLSNPPETTSRNMACGHTSSGEDFRHPAESSLYCKLHQKFRSSCLSDREEEDTKRLLHNMHIRLGCSS